MGLFNFFNYSKPGPGVSKDEPQKAAPIRFFEIYFRKLTKLMQANLIFVIPLLAVSVIMVLLYLFPTHYMLQLPADPEPILLDAWALYVVPIPLIFLAPFTAGLTFITRNFVREEHAFVWSDFWDAVKGNWKYFLLNGLICYLAYAILSFSLIYYYNKAAENSLFFLLFWICVVMGVVFIIAQYYLPVMFITFDLKFGQFYKNALIFVVAGFGRNLLVTVILGGLIFLIVGVIPVIPLTVLIFLLLLLLFIFSFVSYLVNFAIYPVIEQYMIQPYNNRLAEENESQEMKKDPIEEQYSGIFDSEPEPRDEEEEEDKYVFLNGKLVKRSELKKQELDELNKK